jgi:hypothetical protein
MNPPEITAAPIERGETTIDDLCKHFKLNADIKALPLVVSVLEVLKTSPLIVDGVIPKVCLPSRRASIRLDLSA